MTELLPLVRRLQSDAADSSKSVSDLLRLAKLVAAKLEATDALVWIDRELEGYPNVLANDLPPFRQITGKPRAWNPYHGWQPILFKDTDTAKAFGYCPIGQSLGSLEATLRTADSSGSFEFDYPPEIAIELQKAVGFDTKMQVEIGFGSIWNIVDQVRNLILNWSLALEKAGVLGAQMTFSAKEKTEAAAITHQYFIQNVGVLGNVNKKASVHNVQTASMSLDLDQVSEFLTALRALAGNLPVAVCDQVKVETSKAETALAASPPDQRALRAALGAIGNVCEGAAGSVTAVGIVATIKLLLGA